MSWGMALGGIGLFIFGMLQFEQAIKQLSGRTMKRLLQHYTKKVRQGVGMGIGMTALAQSSTIVSLIVVGFVGAGLVGLHNAMGVIVGANLGSTFTPWMVALLGFKTNIFSLAFYFVGVGGFGMLFSHEQSKAFGWWKLLLGFGLLFMGINFLQESVVTLTANVDTAIFANIGLWKAIAIGLVMAFVMQTSAATSVVILSALSAQLISFELAVSMMIGANLGTAFSTALMGSLSSSGKSRVKKQLMIGHALFNVFAACVVTAFLPWVLDLVGRIVYTGDPIISLTVFHTLFNLIGVVCLSPFISTYCRWISRVLPSDTKTTALHIQQIATKMPEEVLVALGKDVDFLRKRVYQFIASCFGFHDQESETLVEAQPPKQRWKRIIHTLVHKKYTFFNKEEIISYHPDPLQERIDQYGRIKEIERQLYTFIVGLSKEEFIDTQLAKLTYIQERIYALLDAAKIVKDNMHHIEHVAYMDETHIASYWMHLCQQVEQEIAATLQIPMVELSTELQTHDELYNFLQAQMLMENREENGLSNEEITEILKTSRHALYVINLLKQEKLTRER